MQLFVGSSGQVSPAGEPFRCDYITVRTIRERYKTVRYKTVHYITVRYIMVRYNRYVQNERFYNTVHGKKRYALQNGNRYHGLGGRLLEPSLTLDMIRQTQ